jgi:16S rRNA (adenine1518-N6/adenine1519-N6)-dimethyltransferase
VKTPSIPADFAPKKSLGQNFLIDGHAIHKIIRALEFPTQSLGKNSIARLPSITDPKTSPPDLSIPEKSVHNTAPDTYPLTHISCSQEDEKPTQQIFPSNHPTHPGSIIEIGPGLGHLTHHIIPALQGRSLFLVEKDDRLKLFLEQLLSPLGSLGHLVMGDGAKTALESLGQHPRIVVGNLPYYACVPILLRCLKEGLAFDKLVFMFQKEVAQRLSASKGSSAYGRLSIMAQWTTHIETLLTLKPGSFRPAPKVDSQVLCFYPKMFTKNLWPIMESIVGMAFQQRRKMLRQSLKPLEALFLTKNPPHWNITILLESIGISPQARAQDLEVHDFLRLAQWVSDQQSTP